MFKKAERKKAKLRLSLSGPSGSGKTYSAIQLACGLGGKIAMIDTEMGSGELYSHITDYDILSLKAPYSPQRYIAAIKEAEKMGYSVLIIDSLSHAWVGEGGVLDIKDKAAAASKSGNDYFAWRSATPQHNALVDAILSSNLHVISTMRTKTAYEVSTGANGKLAPQKVGLAPVQREDMEYEFTIVFNLSVDKHIATSSKDRTGLFDGQFIKIDKDIGYQIKKWLDSGADVEIENDLNVQDDNNDALDAINELINKCETEQELRSLYKELRDKDAELAKTFESLFSERKKEILHKKHMLENYE